MEEPSVSIAELLQLLPDTAECAELRRALLSVSKRDEGRRWDRSRAYATLDARVLDASALRATLEDVLQLERQRLDQRFGLIGRCLGAYAEGRSAEAVALLLEGAERELEEERWREALAYFEAVLRHAIETGARHAEARAYRGLGKASWRLGRLDAAFDWYGRARRLAHDLGERALEIVSLQGLGNVRAAGGRLAEAEAFYREGLGLCGAEDPLREGQFANNLSQVLRRQGRTAEAAEWQLRAETIWSELDSPTDRVIALNNRGLLSLSAGELEPARRAFAHALELARTQLLRAAPLVNLAEVELHAGAPERAESFAREAEEAALLAGATDLLIETYTVLGVLCRERGDDQGLTFFEKALELGRDGHFPLDVARAHLEYGRLRRAMGEAEEAAAHFHAAAEICRGLGAETQLQEIDAERGITP